MEVGPDRYYYYMDALMDANKTAREETRWQLLRAILRKRHHTATCPLSRNLFKLGEPDMQDIAGEAEMNS